MAELNCNACAEIRAKDPSLITDGWTDTECTSFQNDTGLNPESGKTDCEDLEYMNDCLIGNMTEEIEAYELCGWKAYMQRLMPNLWTMFSAVKCAICGLWTNVHNLWTAIGNAETAIGNVEDFAGSYALSKSGHTFSLTADDGNHGNVTETTYDLSISGRNITLTGSDGTTDTVTVPSEGGKWCTITAENLTATINAEDLYDWTKTLAPPSGYVPLGVVGYNVSNHGSSSGASYVSLYCCMTWQNGSDYELHVQMRNHKSTDVSIDLVVRILWQNA